jgi:HD-GYP domain-containing protein (c-di-GMP phosphodiesterase class II)
MTTDRPYRAALDATAVRKELLRFRGTQFDPSICDTLLRSPEYSKLFAAKEPGESDWQRTPDRGSILRVAGNA